MNVAEIPVHNRFGVVLGDRLWRELGALLQLLLVFFVQPLFTHSVKKRKPFSSYLRSDSVMGKFLKTVPNKKLSKRFL